MESEGKILVVDDDAVARDLLVEALQKEGYKVEAAANGQDAIERGHRSHFDLVLTDIRMGEVSGLDVLGAFKETSPSTCIVLLTAFGSMEGAIEAIKQGAYDYLAKPFKKEEVKLVVRRSLDHARLVRENARIRGVLREQRAMSPLVGNSPVMLDVYKIVAKVSAGKSTVLIEGESGTGKELVARAIHVNSSRRDEPFVPVNCAALSETLLESELFGYEKGAFTGAVTEKAGLFEAANEGTLFLDEIGDFGQTLQAKLLRTIQEQEVLRVGGTTALKVNVRIIAATNKDLSRLVKDRLFREDLFYRLNVVRIVLPPLRERKEDIPMLANHCLQKMAAGSGHAIHGFVPETIELLTRYHWPGNVRELENVIERAVSLAHGPLVLPSDLPEIVRQAASAVGEDEDGLVTLEELEKRYLQKVLRETGGNKMKAARILGIDRRTLYRMAQRFGLELQEDGAESTDRGPTASPERS